MYRLKILVILLIVVGLSSCDLLEKQDPQQSLPFEEGLETVSDFESALIGAYDNVQEFSNGDNSGQLAFLNDIITEDAFWTGSFPTYVEVSQQSMSPSNSSIEGQWNGAYEAINSANIILDGLDNLDADQAAIDDIRGQALFIRALEYYYLVQYFAKPWGATPDNSHLGVPLQLDAVTSQEEFAEPLRSSVTEVYDQIIADLQEAEGLITNTIRNRATSEAATGFLARIALIQERWQDAADLSLVIIDNPNYTLSDNVTEFFTGESAEQLTDESIFEIQHTTQDVPDPANTSLTAVYNAGARDDIQISEEYVSALDAILTDEQEEELGNLSAEDTRVTLLLTGTNTPEDVDQATDADNSTKYEDVVNQADNVPIMRLSEMILTRAEALAELNGVNEESVELLNQIRTRAISVTDENGSPADPSPIQYETGDFADAEELIDAILLERRVELAFEGHRMTDLRRREMDVAGTPWDADQLVFPIPQSQMDANPDLTQNPGYGE